MGTTYHYANLTKREWFSIDALGGNAKLYCLGFNLTARGFELLLVGSRAFAASDVLAVGVGRWALDSIAIIGDDEDDWLRYNDEFADLTADVILLVASHDGFERIGDAAEHDDHLFMQLCHLLVTDQAPELEVHMRNRFGTRFLSRYRDLCRERSGFKPRDLLGVRRMVATELDTTAQAEPTAAPVSDGE